MVTRIFQLLLLISPIGVCSSPDPYMFDMTLFRIGVIVLFMASFIDKPRRTIPQYINNIVLSLLGLCLVSVFIHTFAPVTLMNSQNLFLAILGINIVYIYWDEKQDVRKYILWAGLINLIFFISQHFGFDPIYKIKTYVGEEGAFFGNKQRMMTYFALITPFLYTPLLIISLVLAFFTKQYVILIPLATVLFFKAKNEKKLGVVVLVLLSIVLLQKHLLHSLWYRFNYAWKPALEIFFNYSLIGIGLGAREGKMPDVLGCSYLQFIVGVGIIGAVWFGYIFKKLWKGIIQCVPMSSLLLIMLVEYPIEIPRLWFTVMAIVVMFLLNQKEVLPC
jgi:hypothetical protein